MALFKRKKKNKDVENKVDENSAEKEVTNLDKGESYHEFYEDKIPETREEEIELRIKRQMLKENPEANPKKRSFKRELNKRVQEHLSLRDTHLEEIKPVGNLKFYGSHIRVDGAYASILTFVVTPGVTNSLRPMWGIDLIPKFKSNAEELNDKVDVKLMMNISRRSNKWAEDKITNAKEVSDSGEADTARTNQAVENKRFRLRAQQTDEIATELSHNASYLDLSIRIIVKAPTLDLMEEAIFSLQAYYTTIFSTDVSLVPFYGEQDKEYRSMFNLAEDMIGENYQLTSTELAGSYPFVTRGINDDDGTYVGSLTGEVNSDPVLLNTLKFDDLAVVCASGRAEDVSSRYRKQEHHFKASTAWGVKYAQDALMRGSKVVEFVLNQEDPRKIGASLQTATQHFNVASDDKVGINMLESFDQIGNEHIAFTSLIHKIQTIAKQFSVQQFEGDTSQLNNQDLQRMGDLLEQFYISERMWAEDAKENPDSLRLLGIKSSDVPRLSKFIPFLRSHTEELKAKIARGEASETDIQIADKLLSLFREMADRYSYLFDKYTSINRQQVAVTPRVIYNFGSLESDNRRALMGQFINTFEFGVRSLGAGDVLTIYGVDLISPSVCEYLNNRFKQLNARGVKIVLLYDDSNIAFGGEKAHKYHNQWISNATSLLTNSMSVKARAKYEELLDITLPASVRSAMGGGYRHIYFLNRGMDSSLFNWDMNL